MKSFAKITFVSALCVAGLPLFAAEGVLIVQKTTTGTRTVVHRTQIEKERVRAETVGANGETQAMVFDATKQVLTIVNLDQKTYSEMTKADVDRMGEQMSDAMAKMREQMASLPPAQRAQMEAMMPGRAGGMPGVSKTEYRKAGTDKVGRWTCDKYEGYLNNQKVSELCTVDPKSLGFAVSDFEIARQLGEFFKGMMPQNLTPQNLDRVFAVGRVEAEGFAGLPVRRITYANGQIQSTVELTEASRQSFPASSYEVPAGFQKTEMFGGRGRGRAGQP